MLIQLLLGLVLSALIAAVAYRRASLTGSGMVGAIVVGTIIFVGGGAAWWVLLIAFFISASALSHFHEAQKASAGEKFSKSSRRDVGQVLANGGLGALIAAAHFFAPSPWLLVGFVGVMASVNADTWATELGVLNPTPPRLLTTGKEVEAGTSGAVSLGGTAATLAGAAFIALIASLFSLGELDVQGTMGLFLAATAAGLLGSLADSLMGATVQQIYYCDQCKKETERALHRCGCPTRPLRGWRWLDNDWVNFFSSAFGSLAALGIWRMLVGG